MPVYGTSAATFNDDGVTALYQFLRDQLAGQGLGVDTGLLAEVSGKVSTSTHAIIPPARVRYLSDIAETVRGYHRTTEEQVAAARRVAQLRGAATALDEADADRGGLDDVLATRRERRSHRRPAPCSRRGPPPCATTPARSWS